MILLIDGVRYQLWVPKREEEMEEIVKEHVKEIFGAEAVYFDKQLIRSKAGLGAVPDGFVIDFSQPLRWYIVEVELASHPVYEHVMPQVTKFANAIKSPDSQHKVARAFHERIKEDPLMREWVKARIHSDEIYEFLSGLVAQLPILVVVIDSKTEELEEICDSLNLEMRIVELKTFTRKDVGLAVHAHLFEPLQGPSPRPPIVGWTLEKFLAAFKDEAQGEVARDLYEFCKEKLPGSHIRWGRGKEGSLLCARMIEGRDLALFSIKTNGKFKLFFKQLGEAGLQLDKFADAFKLILGVKPQVNKYAQVFKLQLLVDPKAREAFKNLLQEAFGELKVEK